MSVSEISDYDPRYNQAQTLEGAKARYADHDNGYDETDLERDIERLLERGEWPDADAVYRGRPVPPTGNNPDRNQAVFSGRVVRS